uniref:Uncharacterized protein n=1 Tax=Arundo donax TaxID=35708 RepID=A0A0A9HFR2_ARUDO
MVLCTMHNEITFYTLQTLTRLRCEYRVLDTGLLIWG